MTTSTTIDLVRNGKTVSVLVCAKTHRNANRVVVVNELESTKILREDEINWATRKLQDAHVLAESR